MKNHKEMFLRHVVVYELLVHDCLCIHVMLVELIH